MQNKIITTTQRLCHNGTHACKLADLMQETGATKQQVLNALQYAPFNVRLSKNINHNPLIVIEE